MTVQPVTIATFRELAEDTSPIDAVACCAPLQTAPLAADDAIGLASVLKAIADPARLRVISLLAANEGGEACVCDLTEPLGLSQPTVSHHLKTLVDAGLVQREKRGVWAHFSLVPGALDDVARLLSTAGVPSSNGSTAGVPSSTGTTAGVPSSTGSTAGVPSSNGTTAG